MKCVALATKSNTNTLTHTHTISHNKAYLQVLSCILTTMLTQLLQSALPWQPTNNNNHSHMTVAELAGNRPLQVWVCLYKLESNSLNQARRCLLEAVPGTVWRYLLNWNPCNISSCVPHMTLTHVWLLHLMHTRAAPGVGSWFKHYHYHCNSFS